MNAAIRAVTRTALAHGIKVKAIYRGYKGLIDGQIVDFKTENVSNIIQKGGTILKTARSKEFRTPDGRKKAYENIVRHKIDALVVIGGDGTLQGAREFGNEFNLPIVGLPGTIDNDLQGTDLTIGYTTAINTIMDAVDKIRDTASSHERLFFVEVMGRETGFLALNGAIASGAEGAVIPEDPTSETRINEMIEKAFHRNKNSCIILVAEGEEEGKNSMRLARLAKEQNPDIDVRVTILGHLQRGGSPCATDRIMASRLGVAAIEALLADQRNVMVGYDDDEIVYVPFVTAIKDHKEISKKMIEEFRMIAI